MFGRITPEKAGISSQKITEFIEYLERRGATTHGLMLLKGNDIFYEGYWAPFYKDFCHRMYSQTKSFVGIAIGLLLDEGKLSLSDKITDHFKDKIKAPLNPYLADLTIEQMLTMTTSGQPGDWFAQKAFDRTEFYFNVNGFRRPAGTDWCYDSAGSQVLSSLVERLSGMPLFDYLKLKLFNFTDTFKTAEILKTPNGDSWGDSALLCTLEDMASFGRLLMQGGNWNGKQLISSEYVKKATSAVVDNHRNGFVNCLSHGYGYQIWKIAEDGFAFIGMGDQLTLCLPKKDLMLVITSDNQGNPFVRPDIINGFFDLLVPFVNDTELPENKADFEKLCLLTNSLKLRSAKGKADSPLIEKINGKTFICDENKLDIKEFTFNFSSGEGTFNYVNKQGEKTIHFGINKNVFGKFPQLGYSNEYGVLNTTDGFMYNDAASLCFSDDNKLTLIVQIIDRYFGNFSAIFAFNDDYATANFVKTAEDFLKEYNGLVIAKAE